MGNDEVVFFSTVVTAAVMFVVLNFIARALGGEFRRIYFNYIGKKKVQRYLKDGWRIAGFNDRGYPKTLSKGEEIVVL